MLPAPEKEAPDHQLTGMELTMVKPLKLRCMRVRLADAGHRCNKVHTTSGVLVRDWRWAEWGLWG